ncbi:gluconolactonase [Sphingobium sp. AEW4]|nr:gluconolactonase [Sphingobium sp. AEW4]
MAEKGGNMRHYNWHDIMDGLIFPEGPRWHGDRLWFSDILNFKVHALEPVSGRTTCVAEMEDRPSGLGFLPDGRLLIATMGRRHLLRCDPAGTTLVADLSALCESTNDMTVDPSGRAYINAYFADGTGGLILVEPGGVSRIVATGMKLPNGMAVTADGSTLIVADFYGNAIHAFAISNDGSLGPRQLYADLGDRSPDGLCLDAEGAVWVGLPLQNRFERILPGGEVTSVIECGPRKAVACVLGGEDRRSLFLCMAEFPVERIKALMRNPRDAARHCRGWIGRADDIAIPGPP